MDIFWLGLEALPREIRATEWRSWVRALSDVGLLSRTWITRRYQSCKKVPKAFLSFIPKYTFGTFSSGEGPKSSYYGSYQLLSLKREGTLRDEI